MANNGPQFVTTFFVALCAAIKTKFVTTAEYHSHANAQVKRFNKFSVTRPRYYLDEHQSTCDKYEQSLKYGYDTQVHRTAHTSTFSLVLS